MKRFLVVFLSLSTCGLIAFVIAIQGIELSLERTFTFRIDGVGWFPQSGCMDVIATIRRPDGQVKATLLVTHVPILAVHDDQRREDIGAMHSVPITIRVTPAEAAQLAQAENCSPLTAVWLPRENLNERRSKAIREWLGLPSRDFLTLLGLPSRDFLTLLEGLGEMEAK